MASFQAKIGWKRLRKRENENYCSVPTRRVRLSFKKIAKNFKKLKSTTRASFQTKIGWKRPRKSENKNYCSDHFLSDP